MDDSVYCPPHCGDLLIKHLPLDQNVQKFGSSFLALLCSKINDSKPHADIEWRAAQKLAFITLKHSLDFRRQKLYKQLYNKQFTKQFAGLILMKLEKFNDTPVDNFLILEQKV